MTTEEFSNEFDILLNSYSHSQQYGNIDSIAVNEYEKSVFLTKAQEALVISLYNGLNAQGQSFEKTEQAKRTLSKLVKTYYTSTKISDIKRLTNNSVVYKLPEDLWFITYESVKFDSPQNSCDDFINVMVKPITQDQLHIILKNPFTGANNHRVLRLDIEDNMVELISKYNINEYCIRYVSKPHPIILENLPQELSINGINVKSECSLTPLVHKEILDRAVQLALMSKSIATK